MVCAVAIQFLSLCADVCVVVMMSDDCENCELSSSNLCVIDD